MPLYKRLESFEKLVKVFSNSKIFYINLLHGQEGEDGCWSGITEILGINGSFESVLTSSILMNKYFQSSAALMQMSDELAIPKMQCLHIESFTKDLMLEAIKKLEASKIVVKPNSMGASLLTQCFDADQIQDIFNLIMQIYKFDDTVLLQEYIDGEEFTCGVYSKFGQPKALPVIYVSTANGFLGHYEKHSKGNANVQFLNTNETQRLQIISRKLFSLFRIIGMCRFDFIVSNGIVYFLEGNLIPGFSNGSAFPQMLKCEGISLTEFVEDLVEAYSSKNKFNKLLQYNIEE